MLRHEKHSWLLNHILYLEVQELTLDYEIRLLEMSLSSRDEQVSAEVAVYILTPIYLSLSL